MENKKELCRFIFKNQEKRTELIKEIEEYLDLTFHEIKSNWKINGELVTNPEKYNEYSNCMFQKLQLLNDELANISETDDSLKKDIKQLLNLESENYKLTLNIFNNKLKCLDLKNEEEEEKLLKKEKEISLLSETLSSIREQINDFITNLKYKYLY